MTIIHKEFLIAWLQGEDVQFKHKTANDWVSLQTEQRLGEPSALFWNSHYEFRFKPKEQQYRVALMKNSYNNGLYTTTADSSLPTNEQDIKDCNDFIRWLTDWVPYTVEE